MGSIFLNAGLVAGVALAAVPVILHLFMKQTPKHIIFPALRLIKERQKRSHKKLRVKNWLLLLARMALLALMALALARPRIEAQGTSGEGPTATALIFDTSLSMGYTEKGKTRLSEAKERAAELLKAMNESSKVFIIDSSEPGQPLAQSPGQAAKRLDSLAIHPVNRPINASIGGAYAAVLGSDLPRREIYVLTDLAASQWQLGQELEGPGEALKLKKKVDAFVLRVGGKEVRDVAIVAAETAAPVAVADSAVRLKVTLRNSGPAVKRTVKFWMDDETAPRANVLVDVPANSEIDVPDLVTPKLDSLGLHRLRIALVGEPDALEFDDVRYLTIDVQAAMKVLIVSDLRIDAEFVALALDPPVRPEGLARPFVVERVLTSDLENRLASKPLKTYAAIFLVNVRSLPESWWNKLLTFCHEGGGLVVAPAGRADIANYNQGLAAQLLPADLGPVVRHPDTEPRFTFGKPDLSHPIFARDQKELLAELGEAPIYSTRQLEHVDKNRARVLLRYTDETPALMERHVPGNPPGKVLLWTTAISRDPDPRRASDLWNDFPVTGWGFLAVMDQTAFYLANAAAHHLTYEAGEDAILPLGGDSQAFTFSVEGPGKQKSAPQATPVASRELVISAPAEIGQWTVRGVSKQGAEKRFGLQREPAAWRDATGVAGSPRSGHPVR